MKIAVQCNSPLLQKSLEIFLEKYLCSVNRCDVVIRDEECLNEERCFYIGNNESADLKKPFSKAQLILALERRYDEHHIQRDENTLKKVNTKQNINEEMDFSILENQNKKVEIAKIDSSIDYFEDTHHNQYGLIGKWMLKNSIFSHFSALATQEYYVQTEEKEYLEDSSFAEIRLGQIKQNIRIIEPSLREADGMIFSIQAIESCAAPAQKKASPNGLNSYEACNIANYMGLSNSGKIIIFTDYFENFDIQGKTAALMAQMLWYFLKASAQRVVEFPEEDSSQFTRFIINQSHRNMSIAYFQSKITNRWWIELKLDNKIKIYPCLKEEYEAALQNEIPDEWMFYLKKMELS